MSIRALDRGIFEFDLEADRVFHMGSEVRSTTPGGGTTTPNATNGAKDVKKVANQTNEGSGTQGGGSESGPTADAKKGNQEQGTPPQGKGKNGQKDADEGAGNTGKKDPSTTKILRDGYQAKSDKQYFNGQDGQKRLDQFLKEGRASTDSVVKAEESGQFLAAAEAAQLRREALQAQLDQLSYGSQEYENTEAAYNGVRVTTQRNHILRSGEIGGNITLADGEQVDAKEWFNEQLLPGKDGETGATKTFIDALGEGSPARISQLESHGRLTRASGVTGAYAAALQAQGQAGAIGNAMGHDTGYDVEDIQHRFGQARETLDRNQSLLNGRLSQAEYERYFTGQEDQALLNGVVDRWTNQKGDYQGFGDADMRVRQINRLQGALQAEIKAAQSTGYLSEEQSQKRVKALRQQLAQINATEEKFVNKNPEVARTARGDHVSDDVPEDGVTQDGFELTDAPEPDDHTSGGIFPILNGAKDAYDKVNEIQDSLTPNLPNIGPVDDIIENAPTPLDPLGGLT
jgi:hypothetical protein